MIVVAGAQLPVFGESEVLHLWTEEGAVSWLAPPDVICITTLHTPTTLLATT